MVDGGYQLGIAYDGDGDRAIFVDAAGKIVDGDAVMLLCAKQMKREGRLQGQRARRHGDEQYRAGDGACAMRASTSSAAPVGDKYVMEEMIRRNFALGGEQSGHVIFSDYLFTGRRHRDVAERPADDGGHRTRAGRPGVRADDLSAGALMNLRVQQKVDLKTFRKSPP